MSAGHLAALGRVGWELASLRVTVGRMHVARRVAVALVVVVVLSGCSAAQGPEPTAAPASVGVVPERYRTPAPSASATPSAAWPSPSHLIPGTGLTAGPREQTVIGPTGAHLRYVPPVPGWEPECRPATDDELASLRRYDKGIGHTPNTKRGAPVAVDLPEPGWSVVAYWTTWGSGETHDTQLVRGANGRASGIGTAWSGTHTYGGAAFADGPKALRAARECLGGSA